VRDEIRRIALFASGIGDLTRNRAEQIAKELVKSGEVRREQATEWAKVLFDASRENRQEITRFVRSEIQNQVQALGLATSADLERIDHRLDRIEASTRAAGIKTAKKTSVGRKPPAAKKTVAKKTIEPHGPSARQHSTEADVTGDSGPGPL
jgi:polyhydroxyalkanoate synthesis regulator phasin